MKKNKREEDEEIRRAKANIRTGFITAVIALTLFAVVAIVMIGLMSALGSSGIGAYAIPDAGNVVSHKPI